MVVYQDYLLLHVASREVLCGCKKIGRNPDAAESEVKERRVTKPSITPKHNSNPKVVVAVGFFLFFFFKDNLCMCVRVDLCGSMCK